MEISERLQDLSNRIISTLIRRDEESRTARRTVFGELTVDMFVNENYILYKLMYFFKEKGIVPDTKFINMYLNRNTKFITESKKYVDLSVVKDIDGNIGPAYTGLVLKQYKYLLEEVQPITLDELTITLESFKLEWRQFEMSNTLGRAKMVLYDGLQEGKRFFQGYDDSVALIKDTLARIESVSDKTSGAGFIDSSVMALEEQNTTLPEKIGDFGLVTELNEKLGGYYTTYFYNIIAPTKGGKSKWCARAVHNMMVEHGTNVSVWAHEGGFQAWWAQMVAIHYEYLCRKMGSQGVYMLSQKEELTKTYPNDEVKQLALEARMDLFGNAQYGKLSMIERPFKVETFIDEIENSVQINQSKAVVIDYLQLIGWDSHGLSKPQAIGQAYQKLLNYAKKRGVLVMSPSQMTQDFMTEMAKSKDGHINEIRTAGGESSEVIRTPDINIALYATVEDLQHREMTLLSVPSRLAEPFPPIRVHADLCSCLFSSIQ